jgi:hypothetical protein
MNNDTIFKASIAITTVMESEILPLNVDLKIGLNFDGTDPYHQAIALERVRYLINAVFQNSIFCNRRNQLCKELKPLVHTRTVECWEEPWDQFIALMVFYKVTAILEGKGHVDFIRISGDTISHDLEYMYYTDMLSNDLSEDDLAWMIEHKLESLWYHRSDTSVNEDNAPELTWKQLGLMWEKPDNEVKVTGGDNIKQFTPKIIK